MFSLFEKKSEMPKSGKMLGLVEYQSGSVVSKVFLSKKTGTITFFAFDAGQSLSEHTSPYDAIVQVLEGEVEILISKKPYRLQAGEIILMPANQPHALHAINRFKMMLILIR